jgi:hypothetical protein
MTTTATDTAYAFRRAGIADVTHVARLLEASAPELDLDGDGTIDAPADPEVAASVTRIALSHVVLQHGHLWVADAGDALHAASVWVPVGALGLAEHVGEIVARELDTTTLQAALDPGEDVRMALASAAPEVTAAIDAIDPDVVLTGLAAAPHLTAAERDHLLHGCIAPPLAEIDGVAATVTLAPERVPVLESAGFVRADEVAIGAGYTLWVGRAG